MKIFLVLICLTSNFEEILDDFEKNCWTTLNYYTENSNFYPYNRFLIDSIKYSITLKKYFSSDKSIIDSLFKYENDTGISNWIKPKHPMQSITYQQDSLVEIRKIGALILLENYLCVYDSSKIIIPRNPYYAKEHFLPNIGLILLDYGYMKSWWEKNKCYSIDSIRANFKRDSLNHKYERYGRLKKP